jgi:hypothetical protein
LSNKPTETYSEDGKHLLNLMFFSIGGREIGTVVTFKVFIKTMHGKIYIGENQVNATIISKGSSVGNLPWDGTITVEETMQAIKLSKFTPRIGSITDAVSTEEQTPTPSVAVDTLGLIAPKFGNMTISGMNDSTEVTT